LNFEWERGFEVLDRISLRCYKVYVKFLLKTGLFGLLSLLMWETAFAVSGPFTVNVDVPPGQWKAARLKNLPKDATLAVKVESSGDVIVIILDSTSKGKPDVSRPLFTGRVEKRLSFSVTVGEAGDHYLVLDNRRGSEPRAVKVTVQAAPSSSDRLQAADKVMKLVELQLAQGFIFDPFPIGIKQCGVPRAFAETSGAMLCTEYVYHLYDALKDQEKARDFLFFSIYHEVSQELLQKWNHPEAAKIETTDEFAVALMLMLNLKSRVLGAADYAVKNPSAFSAMTKLFQDERHPLSAQRAKSVLKWAKDSDFLKRWQAFLVPHMQTALLKRLKQKPTAWTDLSLVEKELASRDKKAI
jgi:hypothetical protein